MWSDSYYPDALGGWPLGYLSLHAVAVGGQVICGDCFATPAVIYELTSWTVMTIHINMLHVRLYWCGTHY